MMEQVPCELIEINHPNEDAPLLITCNFRETVRIMKTILESTQTPAFLLPTFTHGMATRLTMRFTNECSKQSKSGRP
jgi:CO dehydrogenase/acetyl-CoA synthase gamma subunit (corrinoid Fe-S protein)